MIFLRENDSRSKRTILLIWIVTALEAINGILSYLRFNLLDGFFDDDEFIESDFVFLDNLDSIFTIVYMAILVISGIFFIQWFRRAYFNLHLVSTNLKSSEGWASGSWFVPFVNLYRPVGIMRELYSRTSEILVEKKVRFESKKNIISLWWTFWILTAVLSNSIMRYSFNITTLEQVQNLAFMNIILSVLNIILGFLALKVVNDYIYLEEKLHKINFNSIE